jgi:hypothetical protein
MMKKVERVAKSKLMLFEWQRSTSVPWLAATLRKQDRLGKLDLEKGLLFLSLRRARFDCDRGERAQKGFELAANELVQCHVVGCLLSDESRWKVVPSRVVFDNRLDHESDFPALDQSLQSRLRRARLHRSECTSLVASLAPLHLESLPCPPRTKSSSSALPAHAGPRPQMHPAQICAPCLPPAPQLPLQSPRAKPHFCRSSILPCVLHRPRLQPRLQVECMFTRYPRPHLRGPRSFRRCQRPQKRSALRPQFRLPMSTTNRARRQYPAQLLLRRRRRSPLLPPRRLTIRRFARRLPLRLAFRPCSSA